MSNSRIFLLCFLFLSIVSLCSNLKAGEITHCSSLSSLNSFSLAWYSILFCKNTHQHSSTLIILLVLPPEVDVEGLRVVVLPEGAMVLLPGEVVGGRELEVETEVGEEGWGPVVSGVFGVMVENEGV